MSKNKLAQVFHFDLYGKREDKYDFLANNSISTIAWNELEPQAPNHFFVHKNFEEQKEYDKGFSVNEIFTVNNVGIVTSRDGFIIDENKANLQTRINDFFELSKEEILKKFELKENTTWKINDIKLKAKSFDSKAIKKISYRPFDNRYVYYNQFFIERSRTEVMQHFLKGENLGLAGIRTNKEKDEVGYSNVFITKNISEARLADRFITNLFPLYLYPESNGQQTIDQTSERTPNLNPDIVAEIATKLGLTFVPEKENGNLCFANNQDDLRDEYKQTFAPIDILDYIYAVLHSPTYREKYKEFLKIDFPRVPYPKDADTFWELVKLGGEIRQIHLLESPVVDKYITQYPVDGSNEVVKTKYENGRVYINDTQYFDNVPQIAWDFYIGGYQPAQKWLKDRKGRKLEFDDILHYQKIIVALSETDRLMKEIDDIEIELVIYIQK